LLQLRSWYDHLLLRTSHIALVRRRLKGWSLLLFYSICTLPSTSSLLLRYLHMDLLGIPINLACSQHLCLPLECPHINKLCSEHLRLLCRNSEVHQLSNKRDLMIEGIHSQAIQEVS
jgi:hypothetical protein